MPLNVRFFGTFEARYADRPLLFRSDKIRALLAYLVVEADRPQLRSTLAALFWGAQPDRTALTNLRVSLARLRETLEPIDPSPLTITRQTVQFTPTNDVDVDVLKFDRLMAECDRHPHADVARCPDCIARLAQAAELYTGDFLAGFTLDDSPDFDDWRLWQETVRHQKIRQALEVLSVQTFAQHEYERSQHYARRQIALEPWREEGHRSLMLALAHSGQLNAALAQYDTLRRALSEDLGIEPSTETNALYSQLKHGSSHTRRRLNLPAAQTRFIGRAAELQTMAARFQEADCRLLTLVGPGGIGKTRLAIHYAAQHAECTGADVCFVACEALTHLDELPEAVANAVQLQVTSGEAEVLDFFRAQTRGWLLVLDNLEQIQAAGGFVAKLLQATPHLHLLATSRVRLNIASEWVLEICGLDLPHDEARLDASDAAQLVLTTAQRVGRTDVSLLSETERRAVKQICHLTEGMPLALELAGASARALTFEAIAQEIERDLDFLASASPAVTPRHASVRVVIEQSWRQLDQRSREIFAPLSIFRGGFTRQAAEQIVPTNMRGLMSLVDKSLVRRAPNGRYSIHPLIAQFIASQAGADASAEALAARHSGHYLNWVIEHATALNGNHARRTLEEFRLDLENVRAAWQYAVAHQITELGRRAVHALSEFYDYSGLLHPALEIFSAALDHVRDEAWRGTLHAECAYLYLRLGQFDRATYAATQAKDLTQALGDTALLAYIEYTSGLTLVRRGAFAPAQEYLERARVLAEEAARPDLVAKIQLGFALVCRMQGDAPAAIQAAQQALELSRQISNRRLEGRALSDLGFYLLESNDQARTQVVLERALEIRQMLGDPWGEASAAANLAALYTTQARYEAALAMMERGLTLCQEVGDRSSYCLALGNLSQLWLDLGDVVRSEQLASEAFALATELDLRWGELAALICLSNVHFERGAWELAARVARQALAYAEKSQALPEQALAGLILSQVLAAQDQLQAAREVCVAATARARKLSDPVLECELAAEHAYLAWRCGDLALARQLSEEVLSCVQRVAPSGQLAWFRMWATLLQVLRALGDGRAPEMWANIRQTLETQAARITEPGLREIFLSNPTHGVFLKAADNSSP